MQLSTKPRYALRILLQLATAAGENKAVKGKELSEQQNVTEAYIEQIMLPLKRSRMIKTVRGCNGGYMLAKPATEISVLNVIEVFEGELSFVNCQDGVHTCTRFEACCTRNVWQELTDFFKSKADSYSIASILENKSLDI